MKASDVYRIFLKASMLPENKLVEVAIEKAEIDDVHPRPGETKKVIILSFKNKVARLILNQGNANKLFALAGDDLDSWPGVVIGLKRAKWGAKDTIQVIEAAANGNGKK